MDDKLWYNDLWILLIIAYIVLAIATFIPTFLAIIRKVELNPNGKSFSESDYFNENNKKRLEQHYSRLNGTLIFWKNQAAKYKRFQHYTLGWIIPIGILIPILIQAIDSTTSKFFVTLISSHIAILTAFHKGIKVENNIKAYRLGESEFYDCYRKLLDTPEHFGKTEDEQIETYFKKVESIRKLVRNAETDNMPSIEDVEKIISKNEK